MASREQLLCKLHDGELAPDEAEALRAELAPEERQKLEALAELDAVLKSAMAPDPQALDALDLWSGLEAKLPSLPAAQPQARSEAPSDARSVTPITDAVARRRRSLRLTALLSTFAAAAGLLLLLRSSPAPSNRCDIEELEVAGESATVIHIPDEHGRETALIWFDHQETDEWESL